MSTVQCKIFVGISMLSVLAFQCTISKSAFVMQLFYQYSLSTEYMSRKCRENIKFSLGIPENFVRSNTEFFCCLAGLGLEKLHLCCLTCSISKAQISRANPKHCHACLLIFMIQQPLYIKSPAAFKIFFLSWLD